jgi:hypothetical protein
MLILGFKMADGLLVLVEYFKPESFTRSSLKYCVVAFKSRP